MFGSKTRFATFTITSNSKNYDIHRILRKNEIAIVDDDTFNAIELRCAEKEEYGLIFPGTLWCGKGSKAESYHELGVHKKEDECCREHDHCANTLQPGECIENVCNNSPYTRSHCDCDLKFQTCLSNLHTITANAIGAIFFNIAKMQCFKEDVCIER
nr:acidic phospholipase A2 PA4-like [Onthophagus taurus]